MQGHATSAAVGEPRTRARAVGRCEVMTGSVKGRDGYARRFDLRFG